MRKLYQTMRFAEQVADLERQGARVRDFLRGIKLKLRKNPEFGTQLDDDPSIWFIPTPDILEIPMGISYTFDDDQVVLLSIWVSKTEEN